MFDDVTVARFWSKVDKSAGPDACWPWTGCNDGSKNSYGRMKINGVYKKATRICLALHTGENIDFPFFALHSCDNPICVNPRHLRWGTPKENTADMHSRGRAVCHKGRRKGVDNPNAKLTEEDVRIIRSTAGTRCNISSRFGISYSVIAGIRSGKLWSHVK